MRTCWLRRALAVLLGAALSANAAMACAVCFGGPAGENPDQAGLNAGVAILFAALGCVQIGFALLMRRLLRAATNGRRAAPEDESR